MSKILVLCYSTCGHVETLAKAIAEGALSVAGIGVVVERAKVLMP